MPKSSLKNWLLFFFAILITLPWLALSNSDFHGKPLLISILSFFCILGAAFILTWACEIAQKDITQNLALAILALISILPEYVVDIYFAWMAGKQPHYISYATANMTGANRLLIGFGWALVVFVYALKKKQKEVSIDKVHSVELKYLLLATLYSFLIPLKKNLSSLDAIVFISLFIIYIRSASKVESIEPEIVGPAELIASLPLTKRRIINILMFIFSGYCIIISAEPFAESLIATGKIFGIEEFILVQWIAPLASESPEIIIACVFVLKGKPSTSMGALISSKVNQWTLLVGMLPLFYMISGMKLSPMHLDSRQVEEILLTSAQSVFAIGILANLSISIYESLILFLLFFTQLLFPETSIRYGYSIAYLLFTFFILIRKNAYQGKMLLRLLLGKS